MKIVNKPWGYEKWVEGNGCVLKEIFMRAGFKSSLQYHEKKDEVVMIQRGTGIFILGEKRFPFKPDSSFHVEPKVVHRVEAINDVLLFEASTPELDDIIRIKDEWGRKDGRIESEHK